MKLKKKQQLISPTQLENSRPFRPEDACGEGGRNAPVPGSGAPSGGHRDEAVVQLQLCGEGRVHREERWEGAQASVPCGGNGPTDPRTATTRGWIATAQAVCGAPTHAASGKMGRSWNRPSTALGNRPD